MAHNDARIGELVARLQERGGSALPDLARKYLGEDGEIDSALRERIAQIEMDTRAFHLTVQRTRDAAKAGHQPGPESSLFKVFATELNKRRSELAVTIAGPAGLDRERDLVTLADPARGNVVFKGAAFRKAWEECNRFALVAMPRRER